jgi:YD repeat-containing protein
MSDGIGLTAYTFHPAGQLGAGQVAGVDGPLTDDTITYSYDELGRVTTRAINGAANTVTWAFDALGRVTSEGNVLGTFSYTYGLGAIRRDDCARCHWSGSWRQPRATVRATVPAGPRGSPAVPGGTGFNSVLTG